MALKLVQQFCDEKKLLEVLDDLTAKIDEDHPEFFNLAFIGILEGGKPFADYLAKSLGARKNHVFPVAYLDIHLYPDDVIDTENEPFSRTTEVPFAVRGKEIILVDDVMFTGRTVRAALTSLLYLGRPNRVRLACVVDRGHRELPIQPDYVGLSIETKRNQGVRVRTSQDDEEPGIYIFEEGA